MKLEIFDKNYENKFMTLPNKLVFICRFKDHNIMFVSLSMIPKIHVFF